MILSKEAFLLKASYLGGLYDRNAQYVFCSRK
jgi:hypothetical protein